MGVHRTAWHLMVARFLDERRPMSVTVDSEVMLSKEPQRADLLLIRKGEGPIHDAKAFLRLWALMGPVALAEYKSRSRPARPGVWSQLFGYAHQYAEGCREELGTSRDLSLFLLVHDITPTLRKDTEWLEGLEMGPIEDTYIPVKGAFFPTWIVRLNALAKEEKEPLIGEFGSLRVSEEDLESQRWLANFIMTSERFIPTHEDFEEVKARFMQSPTFRQMVRESELANELAIEVLLCLVEERFGKVPAAAEQRIRTADRRQILRWAKKIIDAPTLETLFAEEA